MKAALVFLFAVMIAGCAATRPVETVITPPVLLEQTPLPSLPMKAYYTNLVLNMRLLVNEEGTVEYVKFTSGSGDNKWDSLACGTIMNWRFSPALAGSKPVKIWVNQSALIRPADPVYLRLAEIVCRNETHADSVINALAAGSDFYKLANTCSSSPSRVKNGRLGTVDINKYTVDIYYALKNTKPDSYTRPLKYGNRYIIFKREAE